MLIPREYVKNRFDVYGRDSSVFSRGVVGVDRIFAVYTILLVEERFESKGLDVYCLRYSESHTRLGMNRYVIWKTRLVATLVACRSLYWFARNPFYAIKARFGTGLIVWSTKGNIYTMLRKLFICYNTPF